MKSYFKKFSIVFVMLLAVIGFGTIQDGTLANAATVGEALTAPESGWKRYDDTNSNFIRTGNWYTDGSSYAYNGSVRCAKTTNEALKFKFYGTKLRIIAAKGLGQSEKVSITIDGVSNLYSDSSSRVQYQSLEYEISGLTDSIHTVEIKSVANGYWQVDAVDINNNGNLIPYNESISLDKSSMSLKVGDSQQLTATTPAGAQVVWSSSNESIAKYDSTTGRVVAVGEGTCTITAIINDGSGISATCTVNVANKTEPTNPEPKDSYNIVNIAHAKGNNTNNPGGEVTIIFHGTADTTLSVVKTADVKDVWVGDNFTYTLVITNTGTKTAKAVVVNDPAPNHIDFNVSGVTTTQGTVDSSSTTKNIIVNVGDILPGGTVTIKIPSTVIA
jgi:uncharacterized repeat protein (TIGR01451 family)